jgi:hypothetical protein
MAENAQELSIGQMRNICEEEGTKLSTTVPYHPALNGMKNEQLEYLPAQCLPCCTTQVSRSSCEQRAKLAAKKERHFLS